MKRRNNQREIANTFGQKEEEGQVEGQEEKSPEVSRQTLIAHSTVAEQYIKQRQ